MSKEVPFRIALICASNQNRSMAAHHLLHIKGMHPLWSYGTGTSVNLPGPSASQPNVYKFGESTYKQMMSELQAKDESLYSRIGVLSMLKRNASVKEAPERFQDTEQQFDIIFTYENRVFDAVIADLNEKQNVNPSVTPVHVLGLDVTDNRDEAEVGAAQTLMLVNEFLAAGDDWEDMIDEIVEAFSAKTGREVTHHVAFY